MTKNLKYVLVTTALILVASVLMAGCVQTEEKEAPPPEIMFINGTVKDIEYVPVVNSYYGTFVTYKISFDDGRIMVIGTGDAKYSKYEKIGAQTLIEENIRKGSQCSMVFQYTYEPSDWGRSSARYWRLIDVEIKDKSPFSFIYDCFWG